MTKVITVNYDKVVDALCEDHEEDKLTLAAQLLYVLNGCSAT